MREEGLPILVYLLGYYILSFPALHSISTHLFADAGDGLQNFWNNWWVRRAVAHGENPWHTDMLFAPEGVSLIGATLNPFNGFATIPLCWFLNPITAYNTMVVFAFVAGGYTAFLLARELTGTYWPSVFAGAVFTFSPFHFGHAMGHMQLVSLQFLPLFFLAWIRLLRSPSHGRAVLAAITLLLNLLCDYYYTLFAILGGFMLFCCRAVMLRRATFFVQREVLRPLLTFVLACLIACGPLLVALVLLQGSEPLTGSHAGEGYDNDLFGLLVPGKIWWLSEWTEGYWKLHPHGLVQSETAVHLGVTVMLAAAHGLIAGRKSTQRGWVISFAAVGAVFFALSLGPTLLVLGEVYPSVPMPYDLLQSVFPLIALGGTPIRMSIMVSLCAAILAAFGLRHAGVLPRWIAIPFLALYAFEIWPAPQPLHQPEYPPAIEKLRESPPGIVAGLPIHRPDALLYQTRFEKPITAGYVARIPVRLESEVWEQEELLEKGRYADVLRRTGATYLLLDKTVRPPVQDPALLNLATGPIWDLYTWLEDDESGDLLQASTSTEEGTASILLRWPTNAGKSFVCLFSGSRVTPRRILGHDLALDPDPVFWMSVKRDNPIFRGWGRFDDDGAATVRVNLLVPVKQLWYSVLVFDGQDPPAIRSISAPRLLNL